MKKYEESVYGGNLSSYVNQYCITFSLDTSFVIDITADNAEEDIDLAYDMLSTQKLPDGFCLDDARLEYVEENGHVLEEYE